jgi:TonB-linked SusC/RagA family outer membrane protein
MRRKRLKPLIVLLFVGMFVTPVALSAQTDEPDSIPVNYKVFSDPKLKTDNPSVLDTNYKRTQLKTSALGKTPFTSIQQYIKGNASGVFVREGSGEPGNEQFMFIRGLSTPLLSKQDLYSVQPAIYINGAPLIPESGLSYNIQRFDFNKIGPATNPLSVWDINNIESIEVLKTPSDLARLGPLASNGAIWITTKKPKSGFRQFNFDTYFGLLQKPDIQTVNADYENKFRWPFYEKYATNEQKLNYPLYVANNNDPNYYGAANWSDIYYKAKPIYYIGFGLLGGTDRANFRFNISDTKDQNFDATKMDRYALSFGINMLPFKWLTVTGSMNAIRTQRDRNHNLEDRFAETRFVPDLANPVSPNASSYQSLLDKYRGSVDKNVTNSFIGNFSALAKFGNFNLKSQLSLDYQEGVRDVFFGRPLMDNTSFISTYFGFNQRSAIQNSVDYTFNIANNTHNIKLEAGHTFISDQTKYDYVLGYNTPNDFIKIKEIFLNGSVYQNSYDIFAYPFTDKIKSALSSLHAGLGYSYKNIFHVNVIARYDGYSSFSNTNRWLLTPVISSRLNVHELASTNDYISTLAIRGSWGIFGKLISDNRYRIGPQYRVDVGYSDEPTLGSYAGLAALSQTYTAGWVINTYGWPFSEKLNVGGDLGFLKDKIMLGIDFYSNHDKNMIVPVSLPTESGFSYKYVQGMAVQNSGVNSEVSAQILNKHNGVNWLFNANFSWNKNKLTKLPYNLKEIEYTNNKIEIGKPVDAYWVYENKGIINTVADIPQGAIQPDGTTSPVKFGTLDLGVGDAIWRDVNADGVINNRDKILRGHSLPVYTGGFGSEFAYKNFSFNFQFFYGLGHYLSNQLTANKLDFINTENSRNIAYVKEVTYWQKTFDYNKYPVYNPWSGAIPYRLDQDLFLEKADFLKLRNATLGYDLSRTGLLQNLNLSKALLYITGSNLLTITPYKGGDPELVNYEGVFTGRSLPIPKSYIIGLKLNF